MSYDDDFDPDDHTFDPGDDDSVESQVWQLLLLLNPGDEESALAQFTDYREAAAEIDPDELVPVEVVGRVIDWRAGFMVSAEDLAGLVQAIDELSSRWNLDIDWGGEVDDDEFFDDMDAGALCAIAYDRLAEFGYALWAWEAADDSVACWMTLTRDAEPLRELATALHINLRRGSEVS